MVGWDNSGSPISFTGVSGRSLRSCARKWSGARAVVSLIFEDELCSDTLLSKGEVGKPPGQGREFPFPVLTLLFLTELTE